MKDYPVVWIGVGAIVALAGLIVSGLSWGDVGWGSAPAWMMDPGLMRPGVMGRGFWGSWPGHTGLTAFLVALGAAGLVLVLARKESRAGEALDVLERCPARAGRARRSSSRN